MIWSTSADVRTKVQRRWDDGTLLRAYAAGEPGPRIEVPLRRPGPRELGERLGEVQEWARELEQGSRDGARFRLEHAEIGGRLVGRNRLPSRAVVETYAQAWALLGVARQVTVYDEVLGVVAAEPVVRAWVGARPLEALGLHGEWARLLAAYRWLDEHRGSGRYLREISAPGVDTKYAERHRSVLAQLLDVPGSAAGFLDGLGLRAKPNLVRLRPHASLGLPAPLTEVAVRHDELHSLALPAKRAVIVENEITYLSVPVPPDGLVLWGRGFDVDRAGSLPWLRDAQITYWGDLDTHGFAILDRLRAWLPQTRSVLMDLATLLEHRERWGREDRPTSARLTRLTSEEADVYAVLVEDRLGQRVRLEQERIDWAWAAPRLGVDC